MALGVFRGFFQESLERFDRLGSLLFRNQGERGLVGALVLLVLDLDLESVDEGAEQGEGQDQQG